jgi:hypothetical protein
VQNRIDILNELGEISPIIASIGNQNVYHIPSGYFETLSGLIINRIKNTEPVSEEGSPSFINTIKKDSFTVPNGFFESFADNMMARIKSEEQTLSAEEELGILSPLLSGIDRKMPFTVPANYFKQLADNIISGSKAVEFINESSEELSPLMLGLKNRNVYETPAGYFENFSDAVLTNINKPQEAKIISLIKKKSWFKYAAAAVVIGVIGTSAILLFNKNASPANSDPVQSLAKLSDQEMVNYLENLSTPVAFSDSTSAIASLDMNLDNDDKDLLSNIPDDELQKYADEDVDSKNLIN